MIKSLSMMSNIVDICNEQRRKLYGKEASVKDFKDSFIINECIESFNGNPENLMDEKITRHDQEVGKTSKSVNLRSNCYEKINVYSKLLNVPESEVCRRILYYTREIDSEQSNASAVQLVSLKSKAVLLKEQIKAGELTLDGLLNDIDAIMNNSTHFSLMSWNVNKFYGYNKSKNENFVWQDKDKWELWEKGVKQDYMTFIVKIITDFLNLDRYGIVVLQEVCPKSKYFKDFCDKIGDRFEIILPVYCNKTEDGVEITLPEDKKSIAVTMVIAIVNRQSGWQKVKRQESIFSADYSEVKGKYSGIEDYRNRIVEVKNELIKRRIMGVHTNKDSSFSNRIRRFLDSINQDIILAGDCNDYIGNTAKGSLGIVKAILDLGYHDLVPDYAATYKEGRQDDHIFVKKENDCRCEVMPTKYSDHALLKVRL